MDAKDIVGAALVSLSALANFIILLETSLRIHQLPRHRSSLYWLLRNIAAAGIPVAIVFVPVQIGWIHMESESDGGENPWIVEHRGACKTAAFFYVLGLYLYSFTIASIAVERYLAAMQPSGEATNRGRDMAISAGIISLILSIPEVMTYHVEAVPFVKGGKMCTNYGSWKTREAELAYALLEAFLFSGFPLVTMIICYPALLLELRRHAQGNSASLDSSSGSMRQGGNRIGSASTSTIKLSLTLGLGFVICWLPYRMVMLWSWMEFSEHFHIPHWIIQGAQFLATCNPLFNAAAYCGFHFFRRGSGGAQRRDDIELSTL